MMAVYRDNGATDLPFPTAIGGLGLYQLGDEELAEIATVLKNMALFRHYPRNVVTEFESACAAYVGAKHALLVNSGTSALVCALMSLGIGPGDEVLVPGYTYIADASAVIAVGAVPILCEIDETLGICPIDAESRITARTRALIAVHMQGIPCRMNDLSTLCERAGIALIEDSSQCVGGRYFGKSTGGIGTVGVWSLNAFKNITIGEGGVLFTNEDALYHRACYASDPAEPLWRKTQLETECWAEEPFAGHCFRANPISAAMGLAQLAKLENLLSNSRNGKRLLLQNLPVSPNFQVQCVEDPSGDCGTSFAMVFRDAEAAMAFRDGLKKLDIPVGSLGDEGFPARHVYTGWHAVLNLAAHHPAASPWSHPAYMGNRTPLFSLPKTDALLARTLRFGLHANLRDEHILRIAEAICLVDHRLSGDTI